MKGKQLITAILVSVLFSSCKVFYPNEMFKQKDYQFFEMAKKQIEQYVIQPGDALSLQVYSRDGFKLIDVLGGQMVSTDRPNQERPDNKVTTYTVDQEGFAKLPVLGEFYVKGYTQSELENILAQKYAGLFVNPFVVLKVENRRVFVFKGTMGFVIPLNDYPTTLPEVLAKAGGLDRSVKSYNIKVIHGDLKNPQVRIVNLYTLEGLRQADLVLQSNDIVYVEQRKRIASDVLVEIAPILSAITLVFSTITLSKTLGK
ncbi:MAG: polysaccharide biosynthesis/export family protein [Chitinophagales bacterium]